MNSNTVTPGPDGKKSPFDDLSREELISKCKGLLAIAQKAKLSKSDLQAEIESYKLKLEKFKTEKQSDIKNVQTLQELVDSLTEQKLNYITEVDSAQTKIKILQGKCKNYEEDINKYKNDLIIREKTITDVSQKLSDIDSEVISLKRQNKRLVEENEQLISQLAELEARAAEFNSIGLEQRKQLEILEETVQTDISDKNKIEELNSKVKELEDKIASVGVNIDDDGKIENYEKKIEEITQLYESEKNKKDKLNIKLKNYKEKILKCAACINQLKNTRFILTKTVREYSENIPRWQNDIIKASKVLDNQINDLNNENSLLKDKIQELEKQLIDITGAQNKMAEEIQRSQSGIHNELSNENSMLKQDISNFQQQLCERLSDNNELAGKLTETKCKYQELQEIQLPSQIKANQLLKEQLTTQTHKLKELSETNAALMMSISEYEVETRNMKQLLQNNVDNNDAIENLNLQIKALESEKSILVKEKLNARDHNLELENQNKILTDQVAKIRTEAQTLKYNYDNLCQEKLVMEKKHKAAIEGEVNTLKCQIMTLQEKYDLLNKEHDNLQDLNSLLKEEVETLKLSLEQPKDDAENLTDLNVSMQADVVKLETKLAAYKQENASLLLEVKESRSKVKDFDSLVAEYHDVKEKMMGYKTENSELLNEMKEINQVLKERGESISKLQKAISEMERLIETLEKDRNESTKEKEDLVKKIGALEKDLRNAEQNTIKDNVVNDQLIVERDNALRSLQEKDGVIASLKEDIEKLKQHLPSSDLPNEDMSTSTISRAEEHARMKDLDETFEEKYTKLRIFALKLKKKLNETTTQLQNTEQDKAKLEKKLSDNGAATNQIVSKSEDVVDFKCSVDNGEIIELQTKVKSLTAELENAQQATAELEKTRAELESKSQLLASEIEAHKTTKENLEKAKRDIKKKNVLSLEMEDYERSMKELTTKMEENKRKIVQMESTIDTQEATNTAMRTQIKLLEEQVKAAETQNRLIREELQHTIDEVKDRDKLILTKNNFISQLEQDLEDEKRKNEEADLEMTSLLGDKEKIIMGLGEDKAELNNKVKRLEFKCGELNDKLRIVNIELADLKTEYTSYKVRAQAVLRQNQTVDHSQEERLKEEAAALKAQIETLAAKLDTAQEQCSEQSAEAEAARRRAAEAASEAARAQQRTARLQADLARLSHQLEADRTQQQLQISTLTQCYKSQISELENRLQKETELLKKQLAAAQENLRASQIDDAKVDDSNRSQYMVPAIPKDEGSDGELDINVSMIPREEGEGSESAPSPPPSKPYSSAGRTRSPVPLERLLEEGVPDDEALDASSLALSPEQEIADLRRRVQAQQQRVSHITVLLAESEREAARRAQLAELLKGELRRLRAAAAHAHNTEYMKNVTLKFLTLPPGDERGRLVPVLEKILTLTPEETNKIQAVAKGLDPNPGKSWGSYLPWPGGK